MPEQFILHRKNPQVIRTVALSKNGRYSPVVAANSANGLGNPTKSRRNSAPITIAGAFFVPAVTCYGGCAWEAFVPAGFLDSRFTNLRTAATHSLGNERGSSSNQGATQMKHALNPSKIRAAAHRAMALSALHANSSLATRLSRYNVHMSKARALEAAGGAQ
ncbi:MULTISPECIES: hypothetical protein [unclassified Pseudomonas]|uniref:hypothetical protein n=1 Tax=unclassified Pseudomonas TaxID=196821 RepID=UPI0012FD6A95|nr:MULTISPECIES: hypothetical protein [unclassified Pseudomonas]WLH93161.1 hypothetical protein PSH87_00940 [Pseudomonas sp. FP453]